MMSPYQLLFVSLLALLLTGCETLGYYHQAVGGHLSLMMAGEPVDDLIHNPDTDAALRDKLRLANEAREFAETRLSLPVGDAYTEYVPLERPWVLVNLIAAPEFSLEARQWCYPFVGCQSYRGYFDLDRARTKEKALKAEGYDTFIGGVTAYSTLGWFDDPLHTGFTSLPDDRMVALIFHELAHRELYVDDDTAFNESFASAVELEGLRLWARERGDSEAFARALARLRHANQTMALVEETSAQLEQLYSRRDELPKDQLRQRKSALFEQMIARYNRLSEDWEQPGPFGQDPADLNNANLALFSQYNQYIPGFRELLRQANGDFQAFYNRVRRLSEQPARERAQRLSDLGERFRKRHADAPPPR